MALVLGDLDHAHRCKSPLLTWPESWAAPSEAARRLAERLERCGRFVSEAIAAAESWARIDEVGSKSALAQCLGGLSDAELVDLLRNAHVFDCDAGARLIRKRHVSRTIYVLLSGSLEIRDGDRTCASIETPGSIVGEVALFSDKPRTADVVVATDGARLLAFSESSVRALIVGGGGAAVKLLLMVARTLSS